MRKVHLKVIRPLASIFGAPMETQDTQAACGFGLVKVTRNPADVTCKICLKMMAKGDL